MIFYFINLSFYRRNPTKPKKQRIIMWRSDNSDEPNNSDKPVQTSIVPHFSNVSSSRDILPQIHS